MGYFITFEGVEGCGKTTQIKLLAELLTQLGYTAVLTREPGGCPIADKIRTILLDAENIAMTSMAELMLYGAARAQHIAEVIMPALESNKIVLCDRFCDATVAYQSFGRGINRDIIDTLNHHACQGIIPNLTVLIDCDPTIGLKRAKQRIETTKGPREERFELEELAFHKRVHSGYLKLATEQPQRFLVIDGTEGIDAIFYKISAHILNKVSEAMRVVC